MVILGLGSNISDRMDYLGAAVLRLSPLLEDMRCSPILDSPALLPPDAPLEWDMPYLNMAMCGLCSLSAQELLAAIKAIERDIGRRQRGVWGPREIDIDILAMDDMVLETPELSIPHRDLLNRDFALLPLADVAPEWRYPGLGKYHGWLAADIAADKGFKFSKQLYDTGLKIL